MATIQGNLIAPTPPPSNTPLTYVEVSRGYDNVGNGRVVTLTFKGPKDALRIASAQWVALGAKYSIREDGPYSEATVTIGGNSFDPGVPIQDQTAPQVGRQGRDDGRRGRMSCLRGCRWHRTTGRPLECCI